MKTFLSLAIMAFASVMGITGAAQAEEAAAKPKLVAFHSDTCGSCKILGPKVEKALNAVNPNAVEFIKLDFTNEATKTASLNLAQEKGIAAAQKQFGTKTGIAVLVDANGQVVEKFTKSSDDSYIAASMVRVILAPQS